MVHRMQPERRADEERVLPSREVVQKNAEQINSGKVGFWQKFIKHALVGAISLGVPSSSVVHSVASAADTDFEAKEMTVGTIFPSMERSRKTFEKLYSTKTGTIFAIHLDGSILEEMPIPKRLIVLQGSRVSKDRETYRAEIDELKRTFLAKFPAGTILQMSGSKFASMLGNAQVNLPQARDALETKLQQKTGDNLTSDVDDIWDVLSAEDRVVLLDLAMGMLGVESNFDPKISGGIAQFMPPTYESLGMTEKDTHSIDKSMTGMVELFHQSYKILRLKNGPMEIIKRYGLKDGNFLIYALVDSHHAGAGNVLKLCRDLLEKYPIAEDLPEYLMQDGVFSSEDLYSFMTHRGEKGKGGYGAYSSIYVPQILATSALLKGSVKVPKSSIIAKQEGRVAKDQKKR